MKVRGLDGRLHSWSPTSNPRACSQYHDRARKVLRQLYPSEQILEEVALPGCGDTTLYADFYLPLHRLVVEVQGEQHYKQVPHFHQNNPLNFLAAKRRDQQKQEWCELNNLRLVELPYTEDDDGWKSRLVSE